MDKHGLKVPLPMAEELDLVTLTTPRAQEENTIRVVCISDTHSITESLQPIPSGDILVHAGDLTNVGEVKDIVEFNNFMGQLPHPHKIVIAGNHDMLFDGGEFEMKKAYWEVLRPEENTPQYVRSLLTNCTYLEDSGCEVLGYNIYGTPWQPTFCNWAFNLDTQVEREDKWKLIPDNTHILIVHGPPYGIGDITYDHQRTGCVGLLETIQMRVRPLLAVFGHIHEARGAWTDGSTTYLNASSVNIDYKPVFKPIIIDLPKKL